MHILNLEDWHNAVPAILSFQHLTLTLETPKVVPLTCHGHSRPVTHLSYSAVVEEDQFYLISASKGTLIGNTLVSILI
jgi:hypothetical protein